MSEPWYSDGLFFSCVHCGRCCRRAGIVSLASAELSAIAAFMKLSEEEFFRRYACRDGQRMILRDGARGECIFYDWDSALCRIYPFRPAQCRSYPFWPALLASREAWERESALCPGIGTGVFHSMESLEAMSDDGDST